MRDVKASMGMLKRDMAVAGNGDVEDLEVVVSCGHVASCSGAGHPFGSTGSLTDIAGASGAWGASAAGERSDGRGAEGRSRQPVVI